MVLARSDSSAWLPLYRAIAINTLELKAAADFHLAPRDLDLVPQQYPAEGPERSAARRPSGRHPPRVRADHTRGGRPDPDRRRPRRAGASRCSTATASGSVPKPSDLLHRQNHGGVPQELAQSLGDCLHILHGWRQSRDQACWILERQLRP